MGVDDAVSGHDGKVPLPGRRRDKQQVARGRWRDRPAAQRLQRALDPAVVVAAKGIGLHSVGRDARC
jgi:hypothetical protein